MKRLSEASFLGKLLVSPANVRLDWKVIATYKHSSLFGLIDSDEGKKFYDIDIWGKMLQNFFPLLVMMRPNKLECLYLEVTSLTFAGNTRSLPKKEASERCSNWVGSGLALKF